MSLPADDQLDPLTQLAIKHGTDKWGPHFYTPVYHKLFAHLRERPLRLLEIGVGGYEYAATRSPCGPTTSHMPRSPVWTSRRRSSPSIHG
jgi:hypothetical protein